MEPAQASHRSHAPLLSAILLLGAAYLIALSFGVPQRGTELVVRAAEHEAAQHSQGEQGGATPAADQHPPLWMIIPFLALLGGIAVLPLLLPTRHWWEANRHKLLFAGGLAAATLAYYLWLWEQPIKGHWPAEHVSLPNRAGLNFSSTWDVIANAILGEYVPFIILLFSLYTISGGIRLEGDLPAHPLTNTTFLAMGAVLASIIGTTGAAMLLIRPLLETNSERKHVRHTVIFFIFIVCNCGGCLLPTGDPPLFLGYLLGVDFLWTLRLWKEWLFVNGMLVALYYCWDRWICYPREVVADIVRDETQVRPLRVRGLWPNGLLLAGVIVSVGLLDPAKAVPGTAWHPPLYLREMLQLGLVASSLLLGSGEVRAQNHFNYGAIIEVAVLFFGIFICMQPPLQILDIEGPHLGLTQPWHYFWASGSLSSVLDNAPTYVVFFETARSLTAATGAAGTIAGVAERLLVGVSLGAVFMGANTYIGNGPNFMVKSIAEQSGVAMPSFFGYMLYSGLILIPLFVLTTLVFLI